MKKMIKSILKQIRYFILNLSFIKKLSKKPLMINDFSGYNQPYHPSVLYFKDKFNNYKYWMVQTPYPIGGLPYRDRWECPCIYWSNDGIKWHTDSKVNPIDDLTPKEIKNGDFLSDPHLVYKKDINILECWYRITHMNINNSDKRLQYPTIVIKKTSYDGLNWSDREIMIDLQDSNNTIGNMIRSPSIIWDNKKQIYRMWFVDSLPTICNRNIVYAESNDGKIWFNRTLITMCSYIDPWHIDVNYFDNKYHLINYTNNTGHRGINYYESIDGINFKFVKELLHPSKISINEFYSCNLYRSCVLKVDDEIRIYFTAENEFKSSLGLLKGRSFFKLKVFDGTSSANKSI
ncbi:hypothetical protein [Clostridium sp. BL-8]|uniref:hypothetical protein n=1 Tax=Clostridium sp. BL-8 TaxID=349938 RepID=UPI00098C61EB|nr:hypothetical protein [Clostridium sp. BL-8]OOM79439.1 hypothetical protein CLOBL_16130 [Clostridium sp. BL-8]